MTEVVVHNHRRDGIGGGLFEDITTAPVTAVMDGPVYGSLVVVFDGDLTPAQVEAVIDRCATPNANAETLRKRAKAALQSNRDYLATPTHTQAEALAQVEALTRQVNALIRFALLEFDGTE